MHEAVYIWTAENWISECFQSEKVSTIDLDSHIEKLHGKCVRDWRWWFEKRQLISPLHFSVCLNFAWFVCNSDRECGIRRGRVKAWPLRVYGVRRISPINSYRSLLGKPQYVGHLNNPLLSFSLNVRLAFGFTLILYKDPLERVKNTAGVWGRRNKKWSNWIFFGKWERRIVTESMSLLFVSLHKKEWGTRLKTEKSA